MTTHLPRVTICPTHHFIHMRHALTGFAVGGHTRRDPPWPLDQQTRWLPLETWTEWTPSSGFAAISRRAFWTNTDVWQADVNFASRTSHRPSATAIPRKSHPQWRQRESDRNSDHSFSTTDAVAIGRFTIDSLGHGASTGKGPLTRPFHSAIDRRDDEQQQRNFVPARQVLSDCAQNIDDTRLWRSSSTSPANALRSPFAERTYLCRSDPFRCHSLHTGRMPVSCELSL